MRCANSTEFSCNCTEIVYNVSIDSSNDSDFTSMVTELDLVCSKKWIGPFVWSLYAEMVQFYKQQPVKIKRLKLNL